jgi:hypothetical protein
MNYNMRRTYRGPVILISTVTAPTWAPAASHDKDEDCVRWREEQDEIAIEETASPAAYASDSNPGQQRQLRIGYPGQDAKSRAFLKEETAKCQTPNPSPSAPTPTTKGPRPHLASIRHAVPSCVSIVTAIKRAAADHQTGPSLFSTQPTAAASKADPKPTPAPKPQPQPATPPPAVSDSENEW